MDTNKPQGSWCRYPRRREAHEKIQQTMAGSMHISYSGRYQEKDSMLLNSRGLFIILNNIRSALDREPLAMLYSLAFLVVVISRTVVFPRTEPRHTACVSISMATKTGLRIFVLKSRSISDARPKQSTICPALLSLDKHHSLHLE